ncbi:MAG: Na+/H+ antiporter subunit E [Lachnospiraceae bacterium]|nr:Na+/H+ antiporter subunit E [Lachnospiraceae bacterium]
MAILLFLLWIIWNGKVNAEILLFGVALTVLVLVFAIKVLGYSLKSERRFWRNFPLFLCYVFVLVREIFAAAWAVARVAYSPGGKPEPVIVEFHSGLPTDFQNALLANSITLTPGTFTLVQEGDRFVVHCLRREYAEGIEDSAFVRLIGKVKV